MERTSAQRRGITQPPRGRARYCLAGPAWRAAGPACPNRDASWVRIGQALGPRGPTGSAELAPASQLVGPGGPTSWSGRANYLARVGQVLDPGAPSPGPRLAKDLARAAPEVGPARPRTGPEVGQLLGPSWRGSGPTCRPTLALVSTVTLVSTTTSPSYATEELNHSQFPILPHGGSAPAHHVHF